MKTMAFRALADLHVVVAGEGPIATTDWDDYIASVRAVLSMGLSFRRMRTLVFSDGGGPNAAQRRPINEALGGQSTRVAMVSSSIMIRGVLTALAWFNRDVRWFAPTDVKEAFRFLEIAEEDFEPVWRCAQELRTALGVPELRSVSACAVVPGR